MHQRSGPITPDDGGFTLIELLVVITILGILAAIVVFAVQGLGDKGDAAARATDASVLRTAEEAYCAQHGTYGSYPELRGPPGFLASPLTYRVVVQPTGPCGGTGFTIGSTTASYSSTTGPLFAVAFNEQPSLSFLAASFAEANGQIRFSFNQTQTLASNILAAGNQAVLFTSSDEVNLNKVIPSGASPPPTGSPGTCSSGTCPGIASTKTRFAAGRMVIFSCKAGAYTLASGGGGQAPAPGPACVPTSRGYNAPANLAAIVTLLQQPGSQYVLAIPNPQQVGWNAPPSPSSSPYGLAAYQALTGSTASGGGGLTLAQYNTLKSAGRISFSGGNPQAQVDSGAADFGLVPLVFLKNPARNDENNATPVLPPPSGPYTTPIDQWAVLLDVGGAGANPVAQAFVDSMRTGPGKSVLGAYGFDPPSS